VPRINDKDSYLRVPAMKGCEANVQKKKVGCAYNTGKNVESWMGGGTILPRGSVRRGSSNSQGAHVPLGEICGKSLARLSQPWTKKMVPHDRGGDRTGFEPHSCGIVDTRGLLHPCTRKM